MGFGRDRLRRAYRGGASRQVSHLTCWHEYERHVLAQCCPEVGLHRDGTPAYGRQKSFQCPTWLRAGRPTAIERSAMRPISAKAPR